MSEHVTVGVGDCEVPSVPTAESRVPDPCVLVIFGITGDLAARKLIPALYQLTLNGSLPEAFAIVGVSRSAKNSDVLRERLRKAVETHSRTGFDPETWEKFAQRIHAVPGSGGVPKTYQDLRAKADALDEALGTCGNRLYYLAVAPNLFPAILQQLQNAGLVFPVTDYGPWSRVVIEKPLGHDLESSRELNGLIANVLDERQTYRIDHYLGKETVQNIMAFRFANAIFEPLWNRKHIEHIQVTVAEDLEVKGRGAFYDEMGVLRDVVQNHVLQILALCTMEPPVSLSADDVRDAKVQAIRSLHPIEVETDVVMGQYEGYREVEGVEEGSRTPTFVAMKAGIDNWRWSGVPFYIRAGKAMSARDTEVAVVFREVPGILFGQDNKLAQNVLVLQFQPDEGISLRFSSKVPGDDLLIGTVSMDFEYARAFERKSGDAYERLLLDAIRGDATLFARRDEVEHAWGFIDPITKTWEASEEPIPNYVNGEDGPEEAQTLIARDGRAWRSLG